MNDRRLLVIGGMLAASMALNVVLLTRSPSPAATPGGQSTTAIRDTEAKPAGAPASVEASPEASPEVPAEAHPTAVNTAQNTAVGAGWSRVQASVSHSVARTFAGAVAEKADELSAEYARLFVWDLSMQRDVQKGDEIVAVWRRTDGADPLQIGAASFKSGKLGKRLTAYRFTISGDEHPSYWSADGTEIPYRLEGGPLRQYVQITSLLKDRPTHKGMDFKCPKGTPVYAPKAGVITRSNWNWKANGNAIELRFADGVVAKFLHLSKNLVKAGDRVRAGQIIARSGNTGRTTAPHLHYQLNQGVGGKVVDPLSYHKTARRKIPAANRAAFDARVAEWDALLERS